MLLVLSTYRAACTLLESTLRLAMAQHPLPSLFPVVGWLVSTFQTSTTGLQNHRIIVRCWPVARDLIYPSTRSLILRTSSLHPTSPFTNVGCSALDLPRSRIPITNPESLRRPRIGLSALDVDICGGSLTSQISSPSFDHYPQFQAKSSGRSMLPDLLALAVLAFECKLAYPPVPPDSLSKPILELRAHLFELMARC
ncbi:hypothetical protein CPB83DRAFT_365113 [Crepidotus variabilis]|uniref:Uncharacterized protein n=1 Tax=Crepidotus variabilis TaxID=179855 RepID=A0A9P6JPP8_9AGAR|nr:hypothetical protein CPB83DRAFT_365113 [Crepidotus variabilis]